MAHNNIFTTKNFSRLMRPHDSRRYKKNIKKDRDQILSEAIAEAFSDRMNFSHGIYSSIIKGKSCKSIKDYSKVLVTRAITKQIQKIFSISPKNRDKTIKGVLEVLADSTPMHIIKRDIESFYESTNIKEIENTIQDQLYIPLQTKIIMRSFFSDLCTHDAGVPRGINLSSALSEIFLSSFDKKITHLDGVHRYFRYVDDILIFCTTKSLAEKVESELEKSLPTGLKFNPKKSTPIISMEKNSEKSHESFEYLGYKFSFNNDCKSKSPREIQLSISDKKIKKIKTRIVLSLKSFQKNQDSKLLLDRIKFISSNYIVRRKGNEDVRRSKFVKSGIFYNYKLCGKYQGKENCPPEFNKSNLPELIDLDKFYQISISKKSIFNKSSIQINQSIKNQMAKISFKKGYEEIMMVRFNDSRIKNIKKAWKNEK